MKIRDFVVLAYGAFGGKISGKTNLQKKVYFLGTGIGKESKLGYRAHYYGPYSEAVAEANSELKSLGYLTECSTSWGSDHRGFEIARYDYALSEEGQLLFQRKTKENPDMWQKIERLARMMESAGDLDYWELSIAAKAHFILATHGGKSNLEEIQKTAKELGWEVTQAELDKAGDFLENMDLIERT